MITLIGEVIYYKRKGLNKVKEIKNGKSNHQKTNKDFLEPKIITFGNSFKPVNKSSVSHISVYPGPSLYSGKGYDTFIN